MREFELLEYLMRYEGQVVSRETLARDVWKETARTTPLDNVIDVHIARLRRKVDLDRPVQIDPYRSRRRLHAPRGRAVRRWWRSHSVRVQLTLWYVAAMTLVLAVYAGAILAYVSRSASQLLNQQLRSDFQWATVMVEQTPEGGITWNGEEAIEEHPWLQVWESRRQAAVSQRRRARAARGRHRPGQSAGRHDRARRRRRRRAVARAEPAGRDCRQPGRHSGRAIGGGDARADPRPSR